MFYRLKTKDALCLLGLVILTYLWIRVDQLILTTSTQRMIAFPVLGLILMVLCFYLIKPEKPVTLSHTMAVILIPLFIILTLVLHLFIFKDGFQNKSIILWIMTGAMIYLAGWIYQRIKKRG